MLLCSSLGWLQSPNDPSAPASSVLGSQADWNSSLLSYGLGHLEVTGLEMQFGLELNFPSAGLPGGPALVVMRAATAGPLPPCDPETRALAAGSAQSVATCLPSPGSWGSTLARRSLHGSHH